MLPDQIERLPSTFTETNLHVEILAPMSGTVVSRTVYEGQTVTEGQALFELADFSTMWLKLDVYEQDLPWLRVGQPVEVEFASHPGHPETHAITFIDPNLQMETRSTQARVEIPNPRVNTPAGPQRRFRHRLLATARVRIELEPVLLVPRTAVLDAGQPRVFVELSDGTYQPRTVVVGRRGDTELEVVSGVTEGERVVTQGALLLDGQAQLNLASQSEPPASPRTPESAPARNLTPEQAAAMRRFLEQADVIRDSLSSDSLERFNEQAPRLHEIAAELGRAVAGDPAWDEPVKALVRASHVDAARDLSQARQQYHTLSAPLVTLARALRGSSGVPATRIYECPMTRRAFPGAPARATWLQLSGPIRNPYFGAEMLDCGTEVKP
jgi:Cu(I)/Ag(I) efflux system membrane fusion protein